jgi:hypothetical protein
VKKVVLLVILTLVTAIFTSCNQEQESNKTSIIGLEGVQVIDVNSRIRISAPGSINTFKINDLVALDIQNYSNKQIQFASSDIHIFQNIGNVWNEIKNNFYDPRPLRVVGPKSPDDPGALVVISPILINQGMPITLHIAIVGTVYKNDKPTSIKTGAYIDLTLYP